MGLFFGRHTMRYTKSHLLGTKVVPCQRHTRIPKLGQLNLVRLTALRASLALGTAYSLIALSSLLGHDDIPGEVAANTQRR